MSVNIFNLASLRKRIKPFRLHWFSRVRSTNDHAARLRRAGKLFAPSIVLASNQIHGRGRGANRWWSGEGSLTLTFVLPVAEHLQPQQVPLIAGLAVRNALAEISGADSIQLKWPNDLLHLDRKLAGLLCERVRNVDLIGVGVNVNVPGRKLPPRLRDHATSLLQMTGASLDMNDVVATLARHVHSRLSRHNDHHFGAILREYDRHHSLVGRRVAVSAAPIATSLRDDVDNPNRDKPRDKPLTGVCVGLDGTGRLLLRDRSSTLHRIVAGHVSLVPAHR
ncbi:MAG: biotin--[acetyl-CoA-carboxylase] ligase [Anaerolineae bacterium]|nr:biotin--[acetyl-CoA-carboxylase] ligase [Phycisphaerae bacterium]